MPKLNEFAQEEEQRDLARVEAIKRALFGREVDFIEENPPNKISPFYTYLHLITPVKKSLCAETNKLKPGRDDLPVVSAARPTTSFSGVLIWL